MADKPPFRYLKFCNHAGHPRGQCKEKATRGTEGKDGNVSFQKLS